jgi:hypothetical protein
VVAYSNQTPDSIVGAENQQDEDNENHDQEPSDQKNLN